MYIALYVCSISPKGTITALVRPVLEALSIRNSP